MKLFRYKLSLENQQAYPETKSTNTKASTHFQKATGICKKTKHSGLSRLERVNEEPWSILDSFLSTVQRWHMCTSWLYCLPSFSASFPAALHLWWFQPTHLNGFVLALEFPLELPVKLQRSFNAFLALLYMDNPAGQGFFHDFVRRKWLNEFWGRAGCLCLFQC